MYTMVRIDYEDGSFHYEIVSHSSTEYRTMCTVEEDIERPGQALTDARLIAQALNEFVSHRETNS